MQWKSVLPVALVSAVLGCAAAIGIVTAFDLGGGHTTTVVQQAPLQGQATSGRGDEGGLTPRDIYKRVAPGVVFIRAQVVETTPSPFDFGFPQEQRGEATGSGFVLDKSGTILTNAHVVAGATSVSVQFADKRVVPATKRTIQAPNGFEIDGVIQTDAAINPGNSGGPLLDATGRVIGINSQIATGGGGNGNIGIGFAVPIDTAKKLLPELKRTGTVERGFLGVDALTIDKSLRGLNLPVDEGALVQTVTPGSPADRAGIHGGDIAAQLGGAQIRLGGDIITAVDGKRIRTKEDLVNAISSRKKGDKVKIDLVRDGRKQSVDATLATRPTQTSG